MIAVGIDVSKCKLDIFYSDKCFSISNDKKEIKTFFTNRLEKDSRIVVEATGKYHRLVQKELVIMGYEVMVINPYQSRHFAKSINVICKTDAVDAKILQLYAEKMDFKPSVPIAKKQLEMQELSRHLDDLKKIKLDLELRLRDSDGYVKKSLSTAIKAIKKQIKETEKKLEESVNKDEQTSEKCSLLTSITGIGKQTAIMLLSNLRELGSLNKSEIVALSGLAPMNNDSGSFKGKRYVRGGRKDIRSKLFMPILGAATKHNKRLKAFYEKLTAEGKAKKVALTACMRKLIIWANAILASGKEWGENFA